MIMWRQSYIWPIEDWEEDHIYIWQLYWFSCNHLEEQPLGGQVYVEAQFGNNLNRDTSHEGKPVLIRGGAIWKHNYICRRMRAKIVQNLA